MADTLRRSVTLSTRIARRVASIARQERVSANRVLADLIESGLESREREKRQFFELADRLASSSDPTEQKRLKKDLARLTYGE